MDDYISNKPIILFDGICNLCNSVVKYVIKNDKNKVFLFCSLQSDKARDILISLNYKITNPESIILLKENRLYKGSEAVLSIVKKLKYPIPLLYFFVLIPKPLREFVYGYIAKRRYKWFGKRDSCMFPTDDIKSRFID